MVGRDNGRVICVDHIERLQGLSPIRPTDGEEGIDQVRSTRVACDTGLF